MATALGPQYDSDDDDYFDAKKGRYDDEKDGLMEEDEEEMAIDDTPKIDLQWPSVTEVKLLNCFIQDLIDYLGALDELVYNHEPAKYHIQQFVEQTALEDPQYYEITDRDQLKEDLSFLAFKEQLASELFSLVPESLMTTQNSAVWTNWFVLNWIMYEQNGPYRYKKSLRDAWFEQDYKVGHADKLGNMPSRKLDVINVNQKFSTHEDFVLPRDPNPWNPEYRYFFHGTDWESVDSILRNGLALSAGPFGQDFSCRHRPGFYVYETLDAARTFAETKASCPAVIVFKLPVAILSDASGKHLDLTTNRHDATFQREVYSYHRSGGDSKVRPETERMLEGCETIRGSVLKNPRVLRGQEGELDLSPDVMQLCVLSEEVTWKFYEAIRAVVYIKKKELVLP